MNFISTIIVLGVIWYIAKEFFNSRPAKKVEKYEEIAELMFRSYRTISKTAYGKDDDDPEVVRMKDWYVRLKEKYKYDPKRLVQLAEDWKDYAYNLSSKNTNHYLWLESEDNESGKERSNEARESHLKIEEIENRFAEGLGTQFRETLEAERKKRHEEAEAFWNPKETAKESGGE